MEKINFYPRSPCGERQEQWRQPLLLHIFLSTLSLRRATCFSIPNRLKITISIHALLAESDHGLYSLVAITPSFLSTLSLRRATCYRLRHSASDRHFYPRSPCGERLRPYRFLHSTKYFYPRSPCGERRPANWFDLWGWAISIHALLAESDCLLSVVV